MTHGRLAFASVAGVDESWSWIDFVAGPGRRPK